MLRHRETALGCRQEMGLECEWQSDVAWNEYAHETMVEVYRPRFRNKAVIAPELAAPLHPRRPFQDIFAQALKPSVGGRPAPPEAHDEGKAWGRQWRTRWSRHY